MDKQNLRFILLSIVIFLGFSLYTKYFNSQVNHENGNQFNKNYSSVTDEITNKELPNTIVDPTSEEASSSLYKKLNNNVVVNVATDVLNVKINEYGDVIFAELKLYPKDKKYKEIGFPLLAQQPD